MSITESVGTGFSKPVSQTAAKRSTVGSSEITEKHDDNVDISEVNAPEQILKSPEEALDLARQTADRLLEAPARSAGLHSADYRLMDVMRSAR